MTLNFLDNFFGNKKSKISASGRTDTGKKRSRNEDSFCLIPNRNIFIVADGMGGHNAGDVASKTAVDCLAQYFIDNKLDSQKTPEAIRHLMIAGFIHTNKQIMAMSSASEPLQGMGCTMIACFIDKKSVHLCHVGDVRGYLANSDFLKQLTSDHTFAAQFKKYAPKGNKALKGPPKNIVSMAIGFPFRQDPEYNSCKLQAGSRIFICSDGLWGMVADDQLKDIIITSPTPETSCTNFIEKANAAGGKDNITVVSIFID